MENLVMLGSSDLRSLVKTSEGRRAIRMAILSPGLHEQSQELALECMEVLEEHIVEQVFMRVSARSISHNRAAVKEAKELAMEARRQEQLQKKHMKIIKRRQKQHEKRRKKNCETQDSD
jgi:hypothetical protein